ncbi:hypothetical protein BS50DRAFT_407849 [Corynespora cassiicola Philippines]|uniref:Uncharacterized protein n=1 Tax=Corynespora cassiicola Philippines TaxID=1448308 RepID=A0A2T2NL38_CORCC|nr:hypothetical protein BS50DRAFT_407849 [Corynespora cassiicola Philippines]
MPCAALLATHLPFLPFPPLPFLAATRADACLLACPWSRPLPVLYCTVLSVWAFRIQRVRYRDQRCCGRGPSCAIPRLRCHFARGAGAGRAMQTRSLMRCRQAGRLRRSGTVRYDGKVVRYVRNNEGADCLLRRRRRGREKKECVRTCVRSQGKGDRRAGTMGEAAPASTPNASAN